jgi:hypothetical protein
MQHLTRWIRIALLTVAVLPGGTYAAGAFVAMAQVTRSDGMKVLVLAGTYKDRAQCEKLAPELINNAIVLRPPPRTSAKLDFLSCDTKAAPGSEFAAMRGEAPATRVIFFTENLRAMPVHPRSAKADEQRACEHIRQQVLTRYGVAGECLAPGK